MDFQTSDLTIRLKSLARERNNTLITEFLEGSEPAIETVKKYELADETLAIDCQYCQVLIEYKCSRERAEETATEKAYKLLNCLLELNKVTGYLGIISLPLSSRCLEQNIAVGPDGTETMYSATRKMPVGWKSTNFKKRIVVLVYVFPSLNFVLSLEDRSKENIKAELNKILKEHSVFESMEDGELRKENLVIEDEPTEAV